MNAKVTPITSDLKSNISQCEQESKKANAKKQTENVEVPPNKLYPWRRPRHIVKQMHLAQEQRQLEREKQAALEQEQKTQRSEKVEN